MSEPDWLSVRRGTAPLLLSLPHTGVDLAGLEAGGVSPWLARKDTDWWVEQLYDFAAGLGASFVRTTLSRSVIDVNRDPSGASLYPGQATTGLCPTTSFDGEPLYPAGSEPDAAEIERRRRAYFEPYHAALHAELERLRALHPRVVLYDCHSIRSTVPRLFEGRLPVFNLGTNSGASADPALVAGVSAVLARTGPTWVVDGRFKGGWITRRYGQPAAGVHALQMELACAAYMAEPPSPDPENWPTPFDPDRAEPTRRTLADVLAFALQWASEPAAAGPSSTNLPGDSR
ncbi:MAG: N-formylglutamate deformylase [Burkholderiales bacterium]|nr:N-formylglutamate deformylase [Burkholderiales bacterium]